MMHRIVFLVLGTVLCGKSMAAEPPARYLMMRGIILLMLGTVFGGQSRAAELPARYFRLLEAGFAEIDKRLAAEPEANLQALEARPGWEHFPSAVLVAAVLYAKADPDNGHYGDQKALSLALRIGDRLAREQEQGRYGMALDRHRDTYMWLEAFRLLESKLGDERRTRWQRALIDNLTLLAADVAKRQDYP